MFILSKSGKTLRKDLSWGNRRLCRSPFGKPLAYRNQLIYVEAAPLPGASMQKRLRRSLGLNHRASVSHKLTERKAATRQPSNLSRPIDRSTQCGPRGFPLSS